MGQIQFIRKQVMYWLNVSRGDNGETWFKSPEMSSRPLGCCVCSLLTVESRASHTVLPLAEGGMYIVIMMFEKSQAR